MPWPAITSLRLSQLEDALVSYDMGSDPVRDELLPRSRAPSLFSPHKLDQDWKLGGFWTRWTETLVRNKKMLTLFAKADQVNGDTRGEYKRHLEEIMALPHEERLGDLQDFIQRHSNPPAPLTSDASGLPPF